MNHENDGRAEADAVRREVGAQFVRAAVSGQMGDEPTTSPLIGLLQVAEAAEEGLSAPPAAPGAMSREQFADRFPELRDAKLPSGIEARFPELFTPERIPEEAEHDAGDEYSR